MLIRPQVQNQMWINTGACSNAMLCHAHDRDAHAIRRDGEGRGQSHATPVNLLLSLLSHHLLALFTQANSFFFTWANLFRDLVKKSADTCFHVLVVKVSKLIHFQPDILDIRTCSLELLG